MEVGQPTRLQMRRKDALVSCTNHDVENISINLPLRGCGKIPGRR